MLVDRGHTFVTAGCELPLLQSAAEKSPISQDFNTAEILSGILRRRHGSKIRTALQFRGLKRASQAQQIFTRDQAH